MSDTTPKTAAIVELFDVDSPFEGPAVRCRIKPTGLMVTEGGRDASGRVSPDIAEAIANLALAIRLKNEGRSQAHLRDAISEAGPGHFITIKTRETNTISKVLTDGNVLLIEGRLIDDKHIYEPGDVVPRRVWHRLTGNPPTPIVDPDMTPEEARELLRRAGPGPISFTKDDTAASGFYKVNVPNIGKLDASKITIKGEEQKAPPLFTIQSKRGVVEITESGVRANDGDHDGTLMKHAMAALPLILERERDRQLYGPHKVISLQDAVTAIREAIEDGDDATVDAAGDAIAELVRFIGRADDDDTELAEAIAHERKRAQAEEAERGSAETITDAEAHTGVAEGLAAAGRLTFRGEPVKKDHHFTTKEHRSVDPVTGRVTETTTTTHSWTPRR
ncbi:hypothetical protein [Paracoccus hibiscisoli]|uniref:Uncharacterized protein n=1 Tax=Paracoccus hibiscisoli TaxID=2023261 RepID=A0A4U0QVQ2_9RHOB|nr:hypothetical protein [Paracoccus hibiscisoli]TJZ85820.1 hypothetical protein FA740_05315 [Paracoccus hibiscisoli]